MEICVNDIIMVSEIQENLRHNGIVLGYDTDSPYMFCRVISYSDKANKELNIEKDDIMVIKRYAKEEYLPGLYFISYQDVRAVIKDKQKFLDMIVD